MLWQEVSISSLHISIGNKNLFSFITEGFQIKMYKNKLQLRRKSKYSI